MTSPTAVESSVDLNRILGAAQLPALPQSALRLLELSQSPNNGPVEFALPIEADPGLTGQVLKFVNSAYFGFSREISSIKLAITMVGVRTIKNFSLWSAVFSLMPNPKCGPFDLCSLWQDSLRRALFARAFGKLMGMPEAEEPFAAALLQDMAMPLLARELPQEYATLLQRREGGQFRLSALERDRFGWTHSAAAGQMARQWNLPEEFADLIELHTELDDLLANGGSTPGQLSVALSSLLPAASDEGWPEAGRFESSFQLLARDRISVADMLKKIDQEFIDFAPVLKITAPAKSLLMRYTEATKTAG
ncbi:MAG TPA: HDOD domain-containing protein [Pirellulales bacterium]|nr:HDOD domain-containing protein [Pirellulales bacterium]